MKADVPKRLGKRLTTLRHRRGYTQEQLAERCDFTVKFISSIERGLVNVPLVTLAVLASGLGVTISELTLGVDGPLPRETQSVERLLAGRPRREQTAIVRVLGGLADLLAETKAEPGEPR